MYLNDEKKYDPKKDETKTKVDVTYHNDGSSTVHWGGPCGDSDYYENGEEY